MARRKKRNKSLILLIGLAALFLFNTLPEDQRFDELLGSTARTCNLSGKVIYVTDGDTIKILDAQNKQYKIRLAAIDAPEKRQDYGSVARAYLSTSIKQKHVCIKWNKQDQYNRIVGIVFLDGKDINLDMVVNGHAWHYKQYQKEQTPLDMVKYARAERNARASALGLWRDKRATSPWDWRHNKSKTASR